MKRIFNIISAALVALIFVGCKPTENNYRSAYDAALAKRQAAAEEQMRPASGLLSDDGPQLRVIEGDSVFVFRERLRDSEGAKVTSPWVVAVGLFKMDTNAKAAAAALREAGFSDAFHAIASGDRYYTICGPAASLDSARNIGQRFRRSFEGYPYVGLPGAPVLISTF